MATSSSQPNSSVPLVQGTIIWSPNEGNKPNPITTTTSNQYNLYQDAASSPQASPRNRHSYKGFSTSICSLFRHPRDCCALACFGFLQWDYNYYLLTHEHPPSLWKRTCRHIFTPLALFLAAGLCATRIEDPRINELCVTILIMCLLIYVVGDCILERMKRVKFRRRLMDTIASGDGVASSMTLAGCANPPLLQSEADLVCAHRLCGCYVRDDEMEVRGDDDDSSDICTAIWQCLANLCCGSCCGCWCQCCGICAIAQEARELGRLVGKEGQMIDYVTFEPYADYYPKISHLRQTLNNNIFQHYRALSSLSILMLKTLCLTVGFLGVFALFDFQQTFTWANLLVFMATFCQAFLILYFVHWKWNRFDLSLDAVVKYFASGFLLSTTLAVFFETIQSLILNLVFNIIIVFTGGHNDDVDDGNKGNLADSDYGKDNPGVVILYIFLTSFFVASFVEEACKYFGFLMLDHPDMITDISFTQLHDEEGSLATETTGGTGSNPPLVPQQPQPQQPQPQQSQPGQQQQQGTPATGDVVISSDLPQPFQRDLNSIGAGITIAMVTVALGFACCENLVYIFVYTGGRAASEAAVLIARSLFPVHPLCAAIQSIGVCRRVLEKDTSYGLGRIILPSLILHGLFDFSLMLISFLYKLNQSSSNDDENDEDEDESEDFIGSYSFFIAFGLVLGGFLYYFFQSHKQKKRLNDLENSSANVRLITG